MKCGHNFVEERQFEWEDINLIWLMQNPIVCCLASSFINFKGHEKEFIQWEGLDFRKTYITISLTEEK